MIMAIIKHLPLIFLIIFSIITSAKPSPTSTSTHIITSYGARPDGQTDSSKAFLAAWNSACASPGRSTIVVPSGRFMVKNVLKFSGRGCRSPGITIVNRGSILAPADYQVLGNSNTWFDFEEVDGVTLSGGVFDGQGKGLWACKRSGKGGCPVGVTTLGFTNSKNIVINGISSVNSQLYHIVINECDNVKVQGVNVSASGSSPNTDGIHVQLSSGVTILNSNIATGDDCISIGAGTTNLWMEDISCGPGHGISIGSLGKESIEQGVRNVTVKTATFTNTENGVRIKSWGRPSTGFVKNVLFQHITMVNAHNPIIIDQKYCPDNIGCPGQVSGIRISDVTYQNIHGSSGTPTAINFDCSSEYECINIKLEDVDLTYNSRLASSSCFNVKGSTSGIVEPKSCLH